MENKISVGRIVHFILSNGEHRPAIVVRVWSNECVQLQVFLDGTNDASSDVPRTALDAGIMWATSVPYSEEPQQRSWHWPERD